MAKLREGQKVIFHFNGINQVGTIVDVKTINKSKRYQCRAESGKLYPHLGINTDIPGKIDLNLTKMYFGSTEVVDDTYVPEEKHIDEDITD